jgi:hypothetical protein
MLCKRWAYKFNEKFHTGTICQFQFEKKLDKMLVHYYHNKNCILASWSAQNIALTYFFYIQNVYQALNIYIPTKDYLDSPITGELHKMKNPNGFAITQIHDFAFSTVNE